MYPKRPPRVRSQRSARLNQPAVRKDALELVWGDGTRTGLVPGLRSHVANHDVLHGLTAQCRRAAGLRAGGGAKLTEKPDGLSPKPSCQRGVVEGVRAWASGALEALQRLMWSQGRFRTSGSSVGLVPKTCWHPSQEFFDEVVQQGDLHEMDHRKTVFRRRGRWKRVGSRTYESA